MSAPYSSTGHLISASQPQSLVANGRDNNQASRRRTSKVQSVLFTKGKQDWPSRRRSKIAPEKRSGSKSRAITKAQSGLDTFPLSRGEGKMSHGRRNGEPSGRYIYRPFSIACDLDFEGIDDNPILRTPRAPSPRRGAQRGISPNVVSCSASTMVGSSAYGVDF